MEWISVEDRLPKIGQTVDVFANNCGKKERWTDYELTKANDGRKYFNPQKGGICNVPYEKKYDYEGHVMVTHWQPPPKPPKEK